MSPSPLQRMSGLDATELPADLRAAIRSVPSMSYHGVPTVEADLMLARLWSGRPASPGFLIHDSTIFDGVDERQRALAIGIAAMESQAFGFQYICTLNSDYIPRNEVSSGFRIEDYIRLRLTDADVTGCLMGVRF